MVIVPTIAERDRVPGATYYERVPEGWRVYQVGDVLPEAYPDRGLSSDDVVATPVQKAGRVEYMPAPPIVSDVIVYNGYIGPYRYNHDAAIASLGGVLYVLWNATTDGYESGSNQAILMSKSLDDGLTWSAPVAAFSDLAVCTNPISLASHQQWQPALIAHGGRLLCIWDREGATTGCYLSIYDPSAGKWTNSEIGTQFMPFSLSGEANDTYTRLASQTQIVLTSAGRLVCPMIAQAQVSGFGADRKRFVCLFSDDDGDSWQIGAPCGPVENASWSWEPFLTERDSVLLAYIRKLTSSLDNRSSQYLSYSMDGGETWTVPHSSGLDIASSRGSATRLPDGRWAILHHAYSDSATNPYNRRGLSVWLSDGGNTAAPAFSISGKRRGDVWAYPSSCMHGDKLAVVSSRANIADGSLRCVGVTLIAVPSRYVFSPSGQSLLQHSPDLTGGALVFGGGENRFCYAGSVSSFSASQASVCIAVDMEPRWARVSTSTAGVDAPVVLYDSRVPLGTTGFLIQIGNGAIGENCNLIYVRYYSGSTLTDQATSLQAPESGKFAVYVTINGTALTATLVTVDGAVTTDSRTIGAPNALNNPPSFACATGNSTLSSLTGLLGSASYYGSTLTAAQLRQWHATYSTRFGLAAWTGTTSALPVSDTVTLDPQGSLSAWPALSATLGKYSLMGRDLRASGAFSLPVPMPIEKSGLLTFRYKAVGGRANNTPICTVGTVDRHVCIYKNTNGDRIIIFKSWEIDGAQIGQQVFAAQNSISDGTWFNVTLRFVGRHLIIEHDRCAPIKIEMAVRPMVFLGWGWRYAGKVASTDTDAMIYDADSIGYQVLDSAVEPDVPASWSPWVPVLKFGGVSTGVTYAAGTPAGYYQIKDGICFVTFDFLLTSKGSAAGLATIDGLPMPAKHITGMLNFGGAVSYQSALAAGVVAPVQMRTYGPGLSLAVASAGGMTDMTDAHFTDTTRLRGSLWYWVQD